MTRLSARKTKLTFETNNELKYRGRWRAVVLEAQPEIILVKLKGTRTAFPISYAAIYHAAAKLEAVRIRNEKKAGR